MFFFFFSLIYLLVYFFIVSVFVYVSSLCNVNKVVFLSKKKKKKKSTVVQVATDDTCTDNSMIWNGCAPLLFNVLSTLRKLAMAKLLRSQKNLNHPTDPVFFHLGDQKLENFGVAFGVFFFFVLRVRGAVSKLRVESSVTKSAGCTISSS